MLSLLALVGLATTGAIRVQDDDSALRAALQQYRPFLAPRFQRETPCPGAPGVMIDQYGTGVGLASQTARANVWQARILWIDATANIERYNSPEKIHDLVGKIADSGFNTVVLDIKPISGQTIYPSQFAPKLQEWRGQKLPVDFDPLPDMVEQCHARHLSLFASMNAFSEGHTMFKVGPGYDQPEHQTVLYVPQPVLRVGGFSTRIASIDSSRSVVQLEQPAKTDRGPTIGVEVTPEGLVVRQFQIQPRDEPKVARGNLLIEGWGSSLDFVTSHLNPGARVEFDTEPTFIPISQQAKPQIPLMMDPNDSEVRSRALRMVEEVVTKYPVDGIIYDDRLRYAGQNGDFSEISRSKFEQFVGQKLTWPDDVFKFTLNQNLQQGLRPGPWYDVWMAWRAQQIKEYVASVRKVVRQARPTAQLGVYVGSWYGDYPALGHNYASPDARAGFWFATPPYATTGTSPLMDFLITGCYYSVPTIYDAMNNGDGIGATVEGAGTLCNRLVRSATWTYAGIDCGPFAHDPRGLEKVVQAACASTQGVMVFDLSHDMDQLWGTFGRLFSQPRKAPHQVPGALAELRRRQAVSDSFHLPEPPIVIAAGATGTGQ